MPTCVSKIPLRSHRLRRYLEMYVLSRLLSSFRVEKQQQQQHFNTNETHTQTQTGTRNDSGRLGKGISRTWMEIGMGLVVWSKWSVWGSSTCTATLDTTCLGCMYVVYSLKLHSLSSIFHLIYSRTHTEHRYVDSIGLTSSIESGRKGFEISIEFVSWRSERTSHGARCVYCKIIILRPRSSCCQTGGCDVRHDRNRSDTFWFQHQRWCNVFQSATQGGGCVCVTWTVFWYRTFLSCRVCCSATVVETGIQQNFTILWETQEEVKLFFFFCNNSKFVFHLKLSNKWKPNSRWISYPMLPAKQVGTI